VEIHPINLVLRVAAATVGASEVPPNTNSGPFVERCQKVTGGKKGDPWCADWLAMIGKAALGPDWPRPLTGSVKELHAWANAKGILQTSPEIGDVFVIWFESLGRFGHTGLVVGDDHLTISGNTSGDGSREGWEVGQRIWTFKPQDRFIRWAMLLP
jgi:hypothetical protein